ncbi:hypothetical protein [Streptomyces cyaneofuscatus]|uniref:hypothetical protein n=1 Tax=Streptomyces cyaneofuscatus TaxID=66883 RepID=UPI003804ADDB
MPMVFVHGVGNRGGAAYRRRSAYQELLARLFLLPAVSDDPSGTPVAAPLWGDQAARARWQHASVPGRAVESLGGAGPDLDQDVVAAALEAVRWGRSGPDTVLLDLAAHRLEDAVDLLFAALPAASVDLGTLTRAAHEAVPVLAYLRAREGLYPDGSSQERHPWLAGLRDDRAFVTRLLQASEGWAFRADGTPFETREAPRPEVLGTRGLPHAVGWLRRQAVSAAQQPLSSRLIPALSDTVTACLGDILVYLKERGTVAEPGPIVRTVGSALAEAAEHRSDSDPLVVVAHSMGGNITYDILTHFRPDLPVDILVTVGSQVGYFEELKLFHASDEKVPNAQQPKVAPPATVGRWINVVDLNDPLAFSAAPVFAGAEDYRIPTGALWAHSGYLNEPGFYERVARRLRPPR